MDTPRILEEDDARALLDQFNTRYDSGVKNRAMVLVMLDAGLRVSEVCSLQLGDVEMTTGRVQIRDSKHGKSRTVYFNQAILDAISEWLECRPASEEGWLFPTRTGNQTQTSSIRRMVKNYAEKAGIPYYKEVSPHTLRHTFATRLLDHTGNIRKVQEALGHSDVSTTMIYTHIVNGALEEGMKSMPSIG